MIKILAATVIFLVIASGLFWIFRSKNLNNGKVTQKLQKVDVRLNWLHQAQFAGMYIAAEKGFYKEAGLEINLKQYEDGIDQAEEVSSGKSDFGVTTPFELFSGIDKGYKNKAIAAIYQITPYAFASLSANNILTPKDFKNRTLGRKGGNYEAKTTYAYLLNNAQINPNSVKFKDISFDTTESEDLTSGTVDVIDLYRTDQIWEFNKKQLKYNLLYPEKYGLELYGDVLFSSDELVKNNPDLVKKFVQATLRGWEYALSHQAEAVDITMKYITDEKYKDKNYQSYILEKSAPLIEPTGGKQIGSMNYLIWNKSYFTMDSAGLIKSKFDVSDSYTTQFLKK